MNSYTGTLKHPSLQAFLPDAKHNSSQRFATLQDSRLNLKPFSPASDNGSRFSLLTQGRSPRISITSASRRNALTAIAPSRSIQNRLTANIKTSTIRLLYHRRVPQPVRSAFRYAANIWQTLVASPVPIPIQVRWESDLPLILSASRPTDWMHDFRRAPRKNTWYTVALANKFAGKDLDRTQPDGIISLNRRQPWYLGTDGNVPAGKFDLVTVALHEIYHVLSTSSFMDYDACTGKGGWGWGIRMPGLFDRFIVNSAGQRLVNTKQFPNPSKALGRQLISNNLFFASPSAIRANNGLLPKLYAPSRWNPSSSIVHLDEATYAPGNENSLITSALELAEAIHNPGPIAIGILAEMGWIPQAVSLAQSRSSRISRDWREIESDRVTTLDFRRL